MRFMLHGSASALTTMNLTPFLSVDTVLRRIFLMRLAMRPMFVLLGAIALLPSIAIAGTLPTRQPIAVVTLVPSGGRVDWSGTTNRIAFDRLDAGGYYRVYTMRPDGSDQRCLTCSTPVPLPRRHQGNPAWHPSGAYLVIQAEKASHWGITFSATPGLGYYNDLWVVSVDGLRAWQITNVSGRNQGVLHPHFSNDG